MSDLIVRDHSQRCEHGFTSPHQTWDVYWCPGGKEIVLRPKLFQDVDAVGEVFTFAYVLVEEA